MKWLNDEFALKIDLGQPQHIPKPTLEELKAIEEQINQSMIFDMIYVIGKEKLYSEEGEESLKYLTDSRGYDKGVLDSTEWFYLPEEYDIKKKLIDDTPEMKEAVGKLKLQGYYGDNFRLAFPYRNNEGMIIGFLKRATEPKGISVTTYDGKQHDKVRWESTPKVYAQEVNWARLVNLKLTRIQYSKFVFSSLWVSTSLTQLHPTRSENTLNINNPCALYWRNHG